MLDQIKTLDYTKCRSVPLKGAYRDRHGRGAECGGRLRRADERTLSGRRSRVVLTPRGWRQAGGVLSAGDGVKKARSPGRARSSQLKPLRAGAPGESGWTCSDYARVLFYF